MRSPFVERLGHVRARPPREIVDLGTGERITTHGLLDAALSDAGALEARFGSLRDRAVLLTVPSGIAWLRSFLAIVLAGGAAVPLPLGARPAEALHVAASVTPRFAIADAALAEVIPADVAVVAPPAGAAVTPAPPLAAVEVEASATALILFTSGTTGKPKAAPLSHAKTTSCSTRCPCITCTAWSSLRSRRSRPRPGSA